MIEPETIIDGRYRVISRLGSGGMADVYLAQDQLLGREVAVKVLHHHFAEDQEFVERFRREASSAAALSHPNIVGIFDRGEWNGTYYIAMEYVAGRSLKAIVREEGALEAIAAIDIVIQILRAARFAHRRGVIHRDLKPHNVILDEEGRARVTDFGIARAGASDMTLTGSIMGTAQYLSPEQAQGYTVSATSDLYSVGVILYELLTGAVPFEGETAVAIAFKQVSAEPRPPSELNPALPPSLDAVVLRALAKDPAARYADAEELIAALQRERDTLPAFSGAHTVAIAEDRVHHAQPAPASGAAGALLLAPPTNFGAEYGPPPQEGRGGGRRALLWVLAAVVLAAVIALAVLLSQSDQSVTVPIVTGQSEQTAGAALRAAGLNPVPSLAPSTTVASGLVISQSPSAGSVVKKGARVGIVVSGGPASAALTNVNGLSAAQAAARLRKAGFKPTTKAQSSTTVSSGIVIGTEPPAGTELQVGSSVTTLVSSGPAPVRVPDVVGQSQSAAEAALTNAELAAGTVTQKVSSTQSPGTVLAQFPSAGSSLHAGEKVNLTVAKAPKEVEVPKVIGLAEARAVAALKHAGLKSKTEPHATTEQSQVGMVIEQTPEGGEHARKGATVTIAVGVLAPQTTPTTSTPTSTPTTPTTTTPTTPAPTPPAG
jgi:eukaryotic-like serine/threonine-protein kinase